MAKIILYHGTTHIFDKVDLNHTSARKDFGAGFYTTTSRDQAIRWATLMQHRRRTSSAYIYSYMLLEEECRSLQLCNLDSDLMYWLQVVYSYRIDKPVLSSVWDVIKGRVAGANAQSLITDCYSKYTTGDFYSIPEDERQLLLKRLQIEKLVDQYCFKSQRSIELLNSRPFIRKEIVNGRLC